MAWVVYCFEKDKDILAIIIAGLLPLCKENAAVFLIMIGLYLAIFKQKRLWGLFVIIYGLFSSYFLVKIIIPFFREPSAEYEYLSYYRYLGNSLSEQITNILTRPWILLQEGLILIICQ